MPKVLKCRNHPLLISINNVRQVYVMLMKTDWESMRDAYLHKKLLELSGGEETQGDGHNVFSKIIVKIW
jgi:hypothetical protein